VLVLVEATPNPLTLKFSPGREVLTRGAAEFRKGQDASASPLASAVLAVPGVASVLLGRDFVSVTSDGTDWAGMKAAVSDAIRSHFMAGLPFLVPPVPADVTTDADATVARIRELLDTRIRPSLASDGGDVSFAGYRGNVLYVAMHGACNGCPSSSATLRHVILGAMRRWVPELVDVRAA